MQGRLENFTPGELIQALGMLAKSGVLRLQRADDQGVVAFRNGKVIYASSPSLRESLGSLLVARGLVEESQLASALSRQAELPEKARLGSILVEMGVVEQSVLESVIREQFSAIISGFVDWSQGTFDFESKELANRGEVELEATEFVTLSGVESTHVLLDAARRADERSLAEEQPTRAEATIDELVDQSTSPTIHGELVYRLLDLGMNACGRCLLFAVRPERFQVIGHVGFDDNLVELAKRLAKLEVIRTMPSLLSRAVEQRRMVLGRLEADGEDKKIQDSLGDPSPSKSVAIPLAAGDRVILVLYGDCLPADLATGQLDDLETSAVHLLQQLSPSRA